MTEKSPARRRPDHSLLLRRSSGHRPDLPRRRIRPSPDRRRSGGLGIQ